MAQYLESSITANMGLYHFQLAVASRFGFTYVKLNIIHSSHASGSAYRVQDNLRFTAAYNNPSIVLNLGGRKVGAGATDGSRTMGYLHRLTIDDTELDDTALAALYSNGAACTGNDGIEACVICPTSNNCISKTDENTQYYLNLDLDAYVRGSNAMADTSVSTRSFITTAATEPFKVPLQGLRFGTGLSLERAANADFFLPENFNVEMWLRVDDEVQAPDSVEQVLFGKSSDTGATYIFSIILFNDHLKVSVGTQVVTYGHNFKANNDW